MQQTAYSRLMYDRQRRIKTGRATNRPRTLVDIVKSCSRTLITFMFTQIGVGALLIGYNVMGALAFQELEGKHGDATVEDKAHRAQNGTIEELWSLTVRLNILDEYTWRNQAHVAIYNYEKILIPLVRDKGYRVLYPKDRWTFSASMMYCLSIYTTIGYGFLTPRTVWGKIATICYAILGMPLMLLYMSNVGEILARIFKFLYFRVCNCGNDSLIVRNDGPRNGESKLNKVSEEKQREKKVNKRSHKHVPKENIPIIWSLCVIGIYVFIGGLIFAHFEGWTTLDGCYFCYISLSTIGHGDIVPGGFVMKSNHDSERLEINQIFLSVYLLIGMALVAMCFSLMQEEALGNLKAFWRGIGCMRLKKPARGFGKSDLFSNDDQEWHFIQLQPLAMITVDKASKEEEQNDDHQNIDEELKCS